MITHGCTNLTNVFDKLLLWCEFLLKDLWQENKIFGNHSKIYVTKCIVKWNLMVSLFKSSFKGDNNSSFLYVERNWIGQNFNFQRKSETENGVQSNYCWCFVSMGWRAHQKDTPLFISQNRQITPGAVISKKFQSSWFVFVFWNEEVFWIMMALICVN